MIEAAAVQRQLFDFAFVDEAGGLLCGDVDLALFGVDDDLLLNFLDAELEVQLQALADGKRDAALAGRLESVMRHRDQVVANGH